PEINRSANGPPDRIFFARPLMLSFHRAAWAFHWLNLWSHVWALFFCLTRCSGCAVLFEPSAAQNNNWKASPRGGLESMIVLLCACIFSEPFEKPWKTLFHETRRACQ
ncbi:unnamed protein product, partial [Phaeothamnion confervicola]